MMTRGTKSRQVENQLQLALLELKASKQQCDQLLKERDDNEKEFIDLINKNSQLKNEMGTLYTEYNNVCDKNYELQSVVNGFDQCSAEYEEALRATAELKLSLQEAQDQIASLQSNISDLKSNQTQSLFDELVGKDHNVASPYTTCKNNLSTIDLTGDDSVTSHPILSKKKLKKYVKINKFIKKTQHLKKMNHVSLKYTKLSKEKHELSNQYDIICNEAQNMELKYIADIDILQSEILSLGKSLDCISNKYQTAQKEISEHILAMNDLVQICNDNSERFDSLTKNYNYNTCSCQNIIPNNSVIKDSYKVKMNIHDSISDKTNTLPASLAENITVFSDEMGKDLGTVLYRECSGQSVTNFCMPGASFSQIVSKAINLTHCPNTTLVFIIGRRGNVNRSNMIKLFNRILELNIKEVIFFTFPYIKGLPHENNIRFSLNELLYTMTHKNYINKKVCHKIHIIDTNSITKNKFNNFCIMTSDKFNLSKYNFKLVANVLSYYLHFKSAKYLANKTTAFIEQDNSKLTCKNNNLTLVNLESVPNHLN